MGVKKGNDVTEVPVDYALLRPLESPNFKVRTLLSLTHCSAVFYFILYFSHFCLMLCSSFFSS